MKNYLVIVNNFKTGKENRIVTAHNEEEAKAIVLVSNFYDDVDYIEEFTPEVARRKYEDQFQMGRRRRNIFGEARNGEIGEW